MDVIRQLEAVKAAIERLWVHTYEDCMIKIACANDIDSVIRHLREGENEDGRVQHD